MSNYYATARSNYFKVKDETKFTEWVAAMPGIGCHKEKKKFFIYSDDPGGAGWPSSIPNPASEEEEDISIDIAEELAPHLVDGEVAVLMETGAEKLCYVIGYALAVNNTGKTIYVNLNDIYDLAKKTFGKDPTSCEY